MRSGSMSQREHGMCGTHEYRCWAAMCQRVRNPHNSDFAEYGGRGITIDPRWLRFANFIADMGPRPPGTWLGRLDLTSDYGPANTRWMSPKEIIARRRPRRWLKRPAPETQAA
jgi:hypothetical protein